jgi:excisionase family DNA binding protein
MSEPWLLRVEEVAERLRLSRSKTYELFASGQIASITIGRARRVPADAVAAWVREQLEKEDVKAN